MAERRKFPSGQQDQFMVRFPDGMRALIADEAKANGRSMNAEIVARLEATFAPPEGGPDVENTLYVLLDANGHPASWQEIQTHLTKIIAAGKFDPRKIEAAVIDPDMKNNSEREEQWLKLHEFYKSARFKRK